MKSFVSHLWGLSFKYNRILLKGDRLGRIASSNAKCEGATKPRANVCCSTSTTLRIFQDRSVCALGSLFGLKWRLREVSIKRSCVSTKPKHLRKIAPSSVVFQWFVSF
ncbi:hypothetical protein PHMEG_00029409 [Phytophthora megakarya]|uniref:Uncharacterized protein n=1 Tax=Phytophthora megakarya TaxID=4795 RepID=A0A225V596_9STRA|nr:hypothetical protein PHMEG_00029409 [Phytophthora megakarya]